MEFKLGDRVRLTRNPLACPQTGLEHDIGIVVREPYNDGGIVSYVGVRLEGCSCLGWRQAKNKECDGWMASILVLVERRHPPIGNRWEHIQTEE